MQQDVSKLIRENPEFQQLVATRGRFAWGLAAVVIVIFYSFVMVVAFAPAMLGERIAAGSFVTVGVVTILSMFVFFWLLTAVYVWRANGQFDQMTDRVVYKAVKESK